VWTVEWLDDQKRRLLTETSSTCQIAVAQPFAARDLHKAKKRKRDVERSLIANSPDIQGVTPSENQDKQVKPEADLDLEVINQATELSPSRRRSSRSDEQEIEKVKTHLAGVHPSDHHDDGPSTEPMSDEGYRFYLLKPRTSSSRHVLVPLTSTATLGECLNGRTVLEFPTIYVFPSSVQHLSDEFMLEEDYLKQEGEEQKEFDDLISELDPEILRRLKDDVQQSGHGSARE
jgi:hypothetical protein